MTGPGGTPRPAGKHLRVGQFFLTFRNAAYLLLGSGVSSVDKWFPPEPKEPRSMKRITMSLIASLLLLFAARANAVQHSSEPPRGGPTARGPVTGGPELAGPEAGGPKAGGPKAGGPEGGPVAGGPKAGGPKAGGPEGGPVAGGPKAGGPKAGGPEGGPVAGGPKAGGPSYGGPGAGAPPTAGDFADRRAQLEKKLATRKLDFDRKLASRGADFSKGGADKGHALPLRGPGHDATTPALPGVGGPHGKPGRGEGEGILGRGGQGKGGAPDPAADHRKESENRLHELRGHGRGHNG